MGEWARSRVGEEASGRGSEWARKRVGEEASGRGAEWARSRVGEEASGRGAEWAKGEGKERKEEMKRRGWAWEREKGEGAVGSREGFRRDAGEIMR